MIFVYILQRQVFKYNPNCNWVVFTKLLWDQHTTACNVNFVGALVLIGIPQRANRGFFSQFRNFNWIPQM